MSKEYSHERIRVSGPSDEPDYEPSDYYGSASPSAFHRFVKGNLAFLSSDLCCGMDVNMYLLNCIACASLCSALLGYDQGVMSGAIQLIGKQMDYGTLEKGIIISILNFFAIPGSMFAGKIADYYGRRKAMLGIVATFFFGTFIIAAATNLVVLIIGRAVAGIGVGAGLVLTPMYIAEISPAEFRGKFVSMTEIAINFGILIGYIANLALEPLPSGWDWRSMLGVGVVLSLLLSIWIFSLPESPRWLLRNDRHQEALIVMQNLSQNDEDAQVWYDQVEEVVEEDRIRPPPVPISELLTRSAPQVKLMLIIGVGIASLQQLSGVEAVLYFTPATLKDAGFKSFSSQLLGTLAVGVTKTVFTIIAAGFVDGMGRRLLLIISSIGIAISLSFAALSFLFSWSPFVQLASLCVFVMMFAWGWGPLTWVTLSEIFPMRLKGTLLGISTLFNRFSSFILSLLFLIMEDANPAGCFFALAAVAMGGAFFVYIFLPETNGKTLEEIESVFIRKAAFLKLKTRVIDESDLRNRI